MLYIVQAKLSAAVDGAALGAGRLLGTQANPQEIAGEFLRANPWMRPEMFVVGCSGPGNRLRDVRVCLTRDGQGRACGNNENPRKLCRADQMHVPPVRSTRREGVAKKENPLQPKRDRGLPRPRVLEAPAPF